MFGETNLVHNVKVLIISLRRVQKLSLYISISTRVCEVEIYIYIYSPPTRPSRSISKTMRRGIKVKL